MESYHSQFTKKPKLGLFGILKESSKIPFRYPKFILFTSLASLPLFFATLLPELLLQNFLISLAKSLSKSSHNLTCHSISFCYDYYIEERLQDFVDTAFQQLKYLLPSLLYFGLVLFLDLINTIVAVYFASAIYGDGDLKNSNLKELGLRGPLVTYTQVLLLDLLFLVGLISLAGLCVVFGLVVVSAFLVLYGSICVVLLGKYVEWSGVFNLGIVISILEKEKQGIVAVMVSEYLSRGWRRRGLVLVLVFQFWRLCLRLWGMYMVWHWELGVGGGFGVVVAVNGVQIGLACLGNVMKWVVFVVYFYDCKSRYLEKKKVDDAEDGRSAAAAE